MARLRRGNSGDALNPWPGYVDALSTLLMVIIFVLLVFVLAQAFLSVALSGRDKALDRLQHQMAEISDALALERGRTTDLRAAVAQATQELQTATAERDSLTQQLTALASAQARIGAERDALAQDRDSLAARLADLAVQAQAAATRTTELQSQLAAAAQKSDTLGQDAALTVQQLAEAQRALAAARAELDRTVTADRATIQARLADVARLAEQVQSLTALRDDLTHQVLQANARTTATQAELDAAKQAVQADAAALDARALALAQLTAQVKSLTALRDDLARQVAEANAQAVLAASQKDALSGQLSQSQTALAASRAELASTVQADRATIAARVAELARMTEQARALAALRDQLEQQAQDAAARATTEADRRAAVAAQLADEQKLGDSARAKIALMTQDAEDLRRQLASVQKALELSENSGQDKDTQIANLGSRLNAALAQKVEELQGYRSEFFGRLRTVLANRPGIQIVGDRFVFQSEVLFPAGSADMSGDGIAQIKTLAATLKSIATEIPSDVRWVLRVDGHADKQPVNPDGGYATNLDLSAARAIRVVELLIAAGVPADRLAATAFGDTQPLDPADTPDAYAKNRRIEIRLTDR